MKDGSNRPFQVTNIFSDITQVNGVLIVDGKNDAENFPDPNPGPIYQDDQLHYWLTSVKEDKMGKIPGTWHWPIGLTVPEATA
jgi:hypothetical protein